MRTSELFSSQHARENYICSHKRAGVGGSSSALRTLHECGAFVFVRVRMLLFYGIVRQTDTHTSESIVIRPPEEVGTMVEALFASYTAHLKNAPNELGWHCLSSICNT